MKINADVGRVRLYTREQTGSGVSMDVHVDGKLAARAHRVFVGPASMRQVAWTLKTLTGKPIFDGSHGDIELMKLAIVTHPAQFPGTQPDEEVA